MELFHTINNEFNFMLKKEYSDKKYIEKNNFKFNNFEIEKNKVKIKSSDNNYEIKYDILCNHNEPIISKINYRSTNFSEINDETKSKILIHGIQEWFDTNNDGIIQDDEKIGPLYYIGENGYQTITYAYSDNIGVYEFNISEKQNGFIKIIMRLTNNFTDFHDPNTINIDITISDWYYQNDENQIALLVEYKTIEDIDTYDDGYIYQKNHNTNLSYSYLEWKKTFLYDNKNEGSVKTRILDDDELFSLLHTEKEYEKEKTSGIWFCFNSKGSNNILWDTNIGINTIPMNSGYDNSLIKINININSDSIIFFIMIGIIFYSSLYFIISKTT